MSGAAQMTVGAETSHQAYNYTEDFVLLGLSVKRDASYGYGLTYHCLTDGCNEPTLTKLQSLLNSTTIGHDGVAILRLIYTSNPDNPVVCSKYTNFTDPGQCKTPELVNDTCSACYLSIDGITNSVCADCASDNATLSFVLLDERAYSVKSRKTSNHNFVVHCNLRECNGMGNIEQLKKLYYYNFDYDRFLLNSVSSLLYSINYYIPILATITFVSTWNNH